MMAGRMMATGWRSGAWSNAEIETAKQMRDDGHDDQAIGDHLKRKRQSVNDLFRKFAGQTKRIYAKRLDEFGNELGSTGRLPAEFDDEEALIKASVQTVEALLADGFKPGHGELNIPAGDNIRLITRRITGSIGSPAGMCAEMGGMVNVGRHFQ
jgi:hypothetical protein